MVVTSARRVQTPIPRRKPKSKSTPWKHAPYMHSFTGAYTHTGGDCFVFRGGDTWVATDYLTIAKGGSSTSPDYYGVDQS